jgi:prepilin-type N-terminal cleavage/methylation domain-containing protein
MYLTRPVKRSETAFTLMELMVVLVIIAILSAVIVTEMSGTFQDALLRSTGRQLIGVFNLASTRAIAVNRVHRVRLDRSSGRYIIEKHTHGDEFEPAQDVPGSMGDLDPRIMIQVQNDAETENESAPPESTPDDGVINFYPDGTADGREVDLRDRDGFGLALRLSAVSARVQVLELERQ